MKNIPTQQEIEFSKYLWEEYKYRHDLVWRLLFRFTGAIVAIIIAPYVYTDASSEVGNWIIVLPLLALILSIIGFFWIRFELDLFGSIDYKFNEYQSYIFNDKMDKNKPKKFRKAVLFYHSALFFLTFFNLCFFISKNTNIIFG